MKKTNKKASHIGVVVSFVMFITFLVFLYTIIQPTTIRARDKQYTLDYIQMNLIGNATGNMTTMIVNVENSLAAGKSCINLQGIITDEDPAPEGEIPRYMVDHLQFKVYDEEKTYEIKNKNNIYVDLEPAFKGVITIKYSEEIIKKDYVGDQNCDPHAYPVGQVKTFDALFETKIYDLNESYYSDYDAFKAYLGIPEDTDFSFYVYDSERNEPPVIKAEIQEPPTDTSIFSQESPIQYVDESGNTVFGFLVIKVW